MTDNNGFAKVSFFIRQRMALRLLPITLLIVILPLFLPLLSPLYAQEPAQLIFVELRLERWVLSREFDLWEQEGRVYAPLGWLSRELRIAITAYPKQGRAEGFVIEEGHRFYLDVEETLVISGEERFFIPEMGIIIKEDDIFIDINLLSQWLPLQLEYSRPDLRLTVLPIRPLPIQMQMERAKRHEKFLKREALRERLQLIPLKPIITPSTWLDGFALDYSKSLGYSSREPGGLRSSYFIRSAFEIAHGDMQLILSGDEEEWLRRPTFFTWAHRRPEDPLLTEVHLGHLRPPRLPLITGSGQAIGVLLSNHPLGLPDSPFQHTFEGSLLPGWVVELYRNEELVAFAHGDESGRFIFENIPLPFGRHTFKKIFHGPLGERREELQHFYLPHLLLLPGETRYKAGAVGSPWGATDDYSQIFALVERGISPEVSLSVGALSIHNYPAQLRGLRLSGNYLSLGGKIWLDNLLLLPVVALDRREETSQALGLRGIYHHPRASLYFKGQYLEEGFISPGTPFMGREPLRSSIEGGVHAKIWEGASGGLSLKEERFGRGPLEVRRRSIDARLFTRLRRIGLSSSLHHREIEKGEVRTHTTTARLAASTAIGRLHTRLGANYLLSGGGWQDYSVAVSSVVRGMGVGISYAESLIGDTRRLSGHLNIPLSGGTLGLGFFTTRGGGGETDFGLSLRFSGSLGWSPHTRQLRTSREPLTNHGSFLGRLFLDFDGDGYQDEEEPGLAGIRLRIGERVMAPKSDEEGKIYLPRLTPYIHHIISVDEASLPDPFFFPKDPALSVMVRPARVTIVSIPILAAGGISGEVLFVEEDLPQRAAAGISLLLLDEDGREVASTRTEFDGFFYMDRIPPGKYRLTFDKKQLLNLELSVCPTYYDIYIPISAEPIFIDDIVFRLIRTKNQ